MKLTRFLILCAIAFSAAACSESTSEFHYFHVESPKTLIYADQSTDTLIIQSTDSWEATTEADWITPKTFDFQITPDASMLQKRVMYITPNKSGKINSSYFTIKCDGRTHRRTCIQASWMNVVSPGPKYYSPDGDIENPNELTDFTGVGVRYEMVKAPDETTGEIIFNLYDKKATISTGDSWITLAQTSAEHTQGSLSQQFKIEFTLEENQTGADRTGTITITTQNGVTQTISIIQKV